MDFNQPFDPRNTTGRGLGVGQLWGVKIRVHWLLLAFFGMLLIQNYLRPTPLKNPFVEWLIFVGAISASLWIHEFAHCLAARRNGDDASEVLLWPLGGLTRHSDRDEPTTQFWIAIAGPVADAIKMALAAIVCLTAGWALLPTPGTEAGWPLRLATQYFFLWNAILLVHNLVPCIPLDAGRVLEASRWSALGSRNEATVRTLKIGRVVAFTALVIGILLFLASLPDTDFTANHPFLYYLAWGLTGVALMHFYEARLAHHRLRYGQVESGIFGYDFSAGYTSLERTATRERTGSLVGAISERFHQNELAKKEERETEMREELDRVLVKIHAEGMQSLTRKEKTFLEDASRRLRN